MNFQKKINHFLSVSCLINYRNPKVTVKIGQSLMFDIGVLSYASPSIMHGLGKNAMFGGVASEYYFSFGIISSISLHNLNLFYITVLSEKS